MLDDKDGMTAFNECVKGTKESLDIMEMQSRGRLIKDE